MKSQTQTQVHAQRRTQNFNGDKNKKIIMNDGVDVLRDFRRSGVVSLDCECLTARATVMVGDLKPSVGQMVISGYAKIDRFYAIVDMGEFSFLADVITGSLFYLNGESKDGKRKIDVSRMVEANQKEIKSWVSGSQARTNAIYFNKSAYSSKANKKGSIDEDEPNDPSDTDD
jgi:hypothetical protein